MCEHNFCTRVNIQTQLPKTNGRLQFSLLHTFTHHITYHVSFTEQHGNCSMNNLVFYKVISNGKVFHDGHLSPLRKVVGVFLPCKVLYTEFAFTMLFSMWMKGLIYLLYSSLWFLFQCSSDTKDFSSINCNEPFTIHMLLWTVYTRRNPHKMSQHVPCSRQRNVPYHKYLVNISIFLIVLI